MIKALFTLSWCMAMDIEHDSSLKTMLPNIVQKFENCSFEELSEENALLSKNIKISYPIKKEKLNIIAKNLIIENNIISDDIKIKCENLLIKNIKNRFYLFDYNGEKKALSEEQITWDTLDIDPFGEEKSETITEKSLEPLFEQFKKVIITHESIKDLKENFMEDLKKNLSEKVFDSFIKNSIDNFLEKLGHDLDGFIQEKLEDHETIEEGLKFFTYDIQPFLTERIIPFLNTTRAAKSYKTRLSFLGQQTEHPGTILAKDIEIVVTDNTLIHGSILIADQMMILSNYLTIEGQNEITDKDGWIEAPYSFIVSDATVLGVKHPDRYINYGGYAFGPMEIRHPQKIEEALKKLN